MLEGALIWDAKADNLATHEDGSQWYIGEDIYEVFNRLTPHLPAGEKPQFLDPIEDILAGKITEDVQQHEIGWFLSADLLFYRLTDLDNSRRALGGRYYRTRFLPVLGKKSKDGRFNETAVQGVIGVIMDVTELKAREADLLEKVKEKRQLVANEAAAKEASRLKGQFLANVRGISGILAPIVR